MLALRLLGPFHKFVGCFRHRASQLNTSSDV
jgi:hypothetical protein